MKLTEAQIKEAIIRSGFVTDQEINEAEKIAQDQNRSTIDILIERGIILEKFLGQTLASYLGFPYADLKNRSIPDSLLKLIPEKLASDKRIIAFDRKNGSLYLAMENPNDIETIEYMKKNTGLLVEPYFVLPQVLNSSLDQYRKNIKVNFELQISANVTEAKKISTLSAKDAPIVKILDQLHLNPVPLLDRITKTVNGQCDVLDLDSVEDEKTYEADINNLAGSGRILFNQNRFCPGEYGGFCPGNLAVYSKVGEKRTGNGVYRSEKFGYIVGGGIEVDLLSLVELNQLSVQHDAYLVRHGESLFKVVGHTDRRYPEPFLGHPDELGGLHF